MEIIRNDIQDSFFGQIKEGECFIHENRVFMRLNNEKPNVVDLKDNCLKYFCNETRVKPIKATLTIDEVRI